VPQYGLEWASDRVLEFLEQYPRGWTKCFQVAGTTSQQMFKRAVVMLRSNQIQWEALKRMVKAQDRSPSLFTNLRGPQRSALEKRLWWIAVDEVLDDKHPDWK